MITNHDLAVIPADVARSILRSDRVAVSEHVAVQLTISSLDRIQRVLLRLLARAGLSDPDTRRALRCEADELDAAVRAARDVLFARCRDRNGPVPDLPGERPADGASRDAGAVPGPPVETALVDTAGTIVWVNCAWHEFCLANGGDPTRAGVGCSYLALCDDAAPDDPQSAAVAAAIRTALRGDLPAPARVEVPCHAPERPRVFDVLISSRRDDGGDVLGATITLSEAVPVPGGM